ncbi:chemotaxis-specific protein-glutamate methyltransferase CheB [Anaeromyxobacter sp. Fw109-5]|uniref:chemotaxis-specific protein-glutamate methyltransferase CheB n=1 Tax=Anaeromyxobacter sp. (strain Fw109-5) TaxID=404589 RepID=UPI000158A700|nr:chemotaxis-specific protein-glutamate methyltransferase CheB [Anaeromyxobacter sp. Fw109-5]ABS27713.1 response regulator receiver modulated CheB methylesterase [Anaeromyxobacter sp. Fw109-5]
MIRCLVVDDARAFRAVLREILSSAPGVEVVGEAGDGREAVSLVRALRPDVVTMDVRMPRLDGLAALEEIMRVAPTPVVVVSAEAGGEAQQLSFRALQLGAIEVLAKPRDPGTPRFERQAEAIRQAVRAVAGLLLVGRRRPARPARPAPLAGEPPRREEPRRPAPLVPARLEPPGGARPEVLAIAASTGGPAALASILAPLPRDLPLPLLVVQHIAPGFEPELARWLDTLTPLTVRLAVDGAPLAAGTVHLAAGGRHLGVRGRTIRLSDEPAVHGFRPSGTHLFSSVARELGARGAGMVLSGMGSDGAEGLAALRRAGGYTAAQSAASSVVYGMPRAALERGAAAHELELDEIPGEILRLAGREARATDRA